MPSISDQTSKPKAIVIAVSDGFGGYGDFLFGLKLAQKLKKKYQDSDLVAPPVYLVTQDSGKDKIKKLEGDTEFDVAVLTPAELGTKIQKKEIDLGMVIEGPVFKSELIKEIEDSCSEEQKQIPLIMMPEYAFHNESESIRIEGERTYRKIQLKKIQYCETLNSGFSLKDGEKGVIMTDELVSTSLKVDPPMQIDSKISQLLFQGKTPQTYQSSTDFSMQYSHDHHQTTKTISSAQDFLNIHREFYKDSAKNQDVLMVGKSAEAEQPERFKKDALIANIEKLKADGFSTIIFHNADTNQEEVLASGNLGKTYRVIYSAGLSHESMIACTAFSGPLCGVTGDQSFGEGFSADKLMVYECRTHKKALIQDYDNAMALICHDDAKETLRLLRVAESEEDYIKLGGLLRQPEIQVQLRNANVTLRQNNDLVTSIFQRTLVPEQVLEQGTKRVLEETERRAAAEQIQLNAEFFLNEYDDDDNVTKSSAQLPPDSKKQAVSGPPLSPPPPFVVSNKQAVSGPPPSEMSKKYSFKARLDSLKLTVDSKEISPDDPKLGGNEKKSFASKLEYLKHHSGRAQNYTLEQFRKFGEYFHGAVEAIKQSCLKKEQNPDKDVDNSDNQPRQK